MVSLDVCRSLLYVKRDLQKRRKEKKYRHLQCTIEAPYRTVESMVSFDVCRSLLYIKRDLQKRRASHLTSHCTKYDAMSLEHHRKRLQTVGRTAEYRLFYRALLQKRPIILRSLLIVATPYVYSDCRQ